jgi:hypothetical protein
MSHNSTRKINIVYLPFRRIEYADTTLKILSQARTDLFHLTITAFRSHGLYERVKGLVDKATELGISASLLCVDSTPKDNYPKKLEAAVKLPYEYSLKLDEDIFLSKDVYNYLFTKGCESLEDDKNLCVTPALSNGIPSIECFIENNLSEEEKNLLHNSFSKSIIPNNLWGVKWTSAQRVLKEGYKPGIWFDTISKIKHHYRGLHPIRYDWDSQILMNNLVAKNIHKFNEKRDFELGEIKAPYFCNSVFLIKTSTWKEILNDISLYVDVFDEVPLNRYKDRNNKKILFIRNAFGIHTMYVLVGVKYPKRRNAAETDFYKKIKVGM